MSLISFKFETLERLGEFGYEEDLLIGGPTFGVAPTLYATVAYGFDMYIRGRFPRTAIAEIEHHRCLFRFGKGKSMQTYT